MCARWQRRPEAVGRGIKDGFEERPWQNRSGPSRFSAGCADIKVLGLTKASRFCWRRERGGRDRLRATSCVVRAGANRFIRKSTMLSLKHNSTAKTSKVLFRYCYLLNT